jgi:hypothetical protein
MERSRVVGLAGVAALALTLVVAVATPASSTSAQVAGLLAVVVAVVGSALLRPSHDTAPSTPTRFDGSAVAGTPGATFDRLVERAIAGDRDASQQVRATLRAAAIGTVAAERDVSQTTAHRAVAAGDWTDDPLASALLADDRRAPLPDRLRLWYGPQAERERRVRRTVQAIREVGS